jgi:hypothetical protein
MIPIQASPADLDRYRSNVLAVWNSATADQEAEGRRWYPMAHGLAEMMCDGDARMGAGLIAALSPQTSWWLNVELAADAYDTGRPSRHVGDALSKAAKILAGMDPADVLPMERKTGQFFRCIADPSDPEAVCIDRHAHDIAVGEPFGDRPRGLTAHGRYRLLADVYRDVARSVGELPSTVQAVTWVVWREMISNTATRGELSSR